PGLLAEAHGGVLYVDEINLLADHLVDTLLDVSVTGENIVERDGISHRHPASFVLVGSMNPEEGELRPQLLDRFGLCVEMITPTDPAPRAEAVRRRLRFDGHRLSPPPPGSRGDGMASLAARLRTAVPAEAPDAVVEAAVRLSIEVGAEGLRADLTLCRAASALAGMEDRPAAELDDLRRVAPLVLAHRRRRGPFDPPAMEPEALDRALAAALDPPGDPVDPDPGADGSDGEAEGPTGDGGGRPAGRERPLTIGGPIPAPVVPSAPRAAPRGRFVRDVPVEDGHPVGVAATARALAGRRARDPGSALQPDDLRSEARVAPTRRTIVLCVDLSGSMGAGDRARAATGMVLGLLSDAYQRRDRVALVGFRGAEAQVLLSPTSSTEVARNRLEDLVTGGETPLAAGIARGLEVAVTAGVDGSESLLVLFTDGRATGAGPDPVEAALEAATTVRRRGVEAMVLDCETGSIRLHLAQRVADAMGARYLRAEQLDADQLTQSIRTVSAP
ncbi:MAG TPA: VWA domain-containing protein, partial [Acidimicrobiales bacterium]|nr:VWA domain-containing protein [Acidimicrobiales bacterium]